MMFRPQLTCVVSSKSQIWFRLEPRGLITAFSQSILDGFPGSVGTGFMWRVLTLPGTTLGQTWQTGAKQGKSERPSTEMYYSLVVWFKTHWEQHKASEFSGQRTSTCSIASATVINGCHSSAELALLFLLCVGIKQLPWVTCFLTVGQGKGQVVSLMSQVSGA